MKMEIEVRHSTLRIWKEGTILVKVYQAEEAFMTKLCKSYKLKYVYGPAGSQFTALK